MKKFLIVTAVSVLLTAGAVTAIYFGFKLDTFSYSVYEKLAAYTIVPLWAFSVVPAYVYTVEWLEDKSFMQAFWLGYVLGLFFPLIIAPVLMVIYFVGTIEKLFKK